MLLFALISYHILVAGALCLNLLSRGVVHNASEGFYCKLAYQCSVGEPLYASDEDIRNDRCMYTPLSFEIQGLAIRLFGLDIRVQRLVSAFFGLGSMVLIALIVRRLTKSTFWAVLAAGLFSGIDVSYWYVMVSPNSAHVFFALLGLYLLMRGPSLTWVACMAAVCALFGSFWSKQTGLAYVVAGLFYIFTQDLKKGAVSALVTLLLAGGFMEYYAAPPGSQFLYRVFVWATIEPMMWSRFMTPVLFPELLGRFGVMIALVVAGVLALPFSFKEYARPHFVFLGAAAFAGPWAELKYGSGNMQSIFFYGLLIIGGISFLHSFLKNKKIAVVLAYVLVGVQSMALVHEVKPMFISDEDEQRFNKIISILSTPGESSYFYAHGYYNVLAGKPPVANTEQNSVEHWKNGRSVYAKTVTEYWQSNPFDRLILFYPWEDNMRIVLEQVQKDYDLAEEIQPSVDYPSTWELRKRLLVFKRKTPAQAMPGAGPLGPLKRQGP
ncbi:MAG: glycosyltransferase family 39 protein [Lentisphaerota bacterium]